MGRGVVPPGSPNFFGLNDVFTVQVLAWWGVFVSRGGCLFRVGVGCVFGIVPCVRLLPVGFFSRDTYCITIARCRVCLVPRVTR